MPRGWSIAAISFTVALSIGIVANNPRYVFAIAALAIFGFLTVGFFLFPRFSISVPFQLGPVTDLSKTNGQLLVAGHSVSPSEFPQSFACMCKLRAWPVLVFLGLFSLSSFCFLVSRIPLEHFVGQHFFETIYFPAIAMAAGLWLSMKWYSEQSLLARSMITLGIVTGISSMGQHRSITYQFRDTNGGYYGGRERDFVGRPVDHLVFILYQRSNPDNSYSSRGFLFRDFKLHPLRGSHAD